MILFSKADSPKVYITNGKKGQTFRYWMVKKLENFLYLPRPQIFLMIVKAIKISGIEYKFNK